MRERMLTGCRGATYNIPLSVWIPLDYGSAPPLVYVVPTTGMLVRCVCIQFLIIVRTDRHTGRAETWTQAD